jgi:methyl-accepting chemotaxis protein
MSKTSAPATRRFFQTGIRTRLTLSVAALTTLTVVVIGIAVYAFNDARQEFERFNAVQIPSVISAGELATFSTDVTIASSQLINARQEDARLAAFADLSDAVGRLVGSAEAQGGSADGSTAVAALQARAAAFRSNLDRLDALTGDNLRLQGEGAAKLAELFRLHDELAATLTPLVDTAYFDLVFDGEEAAIESGKVVERILNTDMQVFRRLLTLRIDAGAAASATSGYLLTEDGAIARTFEDRMIAASDRVRLTVEQLSEAGALPGIADELAALAAAPSEARTMRQRPFYAADATATRDFMARLIQIEQAVDAELIEVIDDTLFDLTIGGEQAVARNTATIVNLVDGQVSQLKNTLEMVSTLREYTALLVQGALTTEPGVIAPLQMRAYQIVQEFEAKARATGNPEAMAAITQLKAFSDQNSGLISTRAAQLDITGQVAGIVAQVYADTVDINGLIADVVSVRRDAIGADSAQLIDRLQQTGMLLMALGGAVLLIAIAIGALIINRSVVRPLTGLIQSTRELADGQLDVDLRHAGRGDELGDLSRALMVFRENAIEKNRMEQEANMTREEREAARAERERVKAEEAAAIRSAVDQLGAGLTRLAHGDVSSQIDEPFVESLETLRLDFNASLDTLRQTLLTVRENASAIRTSSNEMRAGTDNLSRRTEQQAASLEETAAALDEITSTVRNSTSQADNASRMVTEARHNAENSRRVVEEAITAMSRIEAASGQIGQIISVIDEIAFQTNLLALNAGVEAARAGDAGRGFAVVAQEVRELAGRAGTAAKEIKELIRKSSSEVGIGVKLVEETGSALTAIERQVGEIDAAVLTIATAAREQAVGLQEINTAVNHMDQMTQQNAAMVEQTTAATHTLAAEADALRELIGHFVVERGTGSTSRRAA